MNTPMYTPAVAFAGVEEPGNGGRYEYLVWRDDVNQWYAAFPDFGVSSRIGARGNRPDYIQGKMRCSYPDAEVMSDIINRCQEAAHLQGSV